MWYIKGVNDLEPAFRALSETHRRQILDLLLDHPRPVGELVECLQLSQPATSKHLRALRDVGLVRARIERQRRIYEICPEPLREIQHWLRPYRRLWSRSLDRLGHELEKLAEQENER